MDVTAGTMDVTAGTMDVTAGTIDVTAGTIDVTAGTIDVTAGTIDVTAGTIDVTAGTDDAGEGTTMLSLFRVTIVSPLRVYAAHEAAHFSCTVLKVEQYPPFANNVQHGTLLPVTSKQSDVS
jgi:adhesin HecA-like repeat protein